MARRLSTILAAGVLALSGLVPGCPGKLENPARFEGCPPGFDVETRIFQASCSGKLCHTGPDGPAGELDLTSPDPASRLVNVPSSNALCLGLLRIDPTNVENSLLLRKISLSQPGCGDPMPLEPAVPLSDSQIACVREWAYQAVANFDAGAGGSGGTAGSSGTGGSGGVSGGGGASGSAGASGSGGVSSDAQAD